MEETTKKLDSKPDLASLQIPNLQWKPAALLAKCTTVLQNTISVDSDHDFDAKQQIKYGTTCQACGALFLEYCDYSNIHGMRYLGDKKRPILERLFWITAFIFSICICTNLIMNILDKWNNNPVIVSFAEKSTPVWQIPFPVVTVCPETKAKQTVFNFTEIFLKLSDKVANTSNAELTKLEDVRMNALSQLCAPYLMEGLDYGEKTAESQQLIKALRDMMPQFNDTYVECKWQNNAADCQNLFTKIVSEEDFTFQSENRSAIDWNVEDWYGVDAPLTTYPNRGFGSGARSGLYLVLKGIENDFDNICRGPIQGFKILLTTPGDIAQVSTEYFRIPHHHAKVPTQYFRIPFDQEVLISIKPKIMTTSDGLKHYEPHRRQCYFQNERYLRYFLKYTQNNCELECLANFTLSKCHCVKFSMPRSDNIPVCGAASIACMNEFEDELMLKEFNQSMNISEKNYHGPMECNCLPSCASIAYEAEISQKDLDYKTVRNNDENPADILGAKISRLSIFFKEAQFLTSRRSELYGLTDFLANCGGLLSLFMGVSILSLVEILYFCTVRLVSNLRLRSQKRKEMANGVKASKEA